MKFSKYLLVLGLSISTLACGGSGGKKSSPPSTDPNRISKINDFSINGTSAKTKDISQINPAVNSGKFKTRWDVISSNPYHVDLYLSSNTFLKGATVINIFEQSCSEIGNSYNCGSKGEINCKFTSTNKISCDTTPTTNKIVDISNFLNTLPKDAYLVLEACNSLHSSCDISSIPVVFQ